MVLDIPAEMESDNANTMIEPSTIDSNSAMKEQCTILPNLMEARFSFQLSLVSNIKISKQPWSCMLWDYDSICSFLFPFIWKLAKTKKLLGPKELINWSERMYTFIGWIPENKRNI